MEVFCESIDGIKHNIASYSTGKLYALMRSGLMGSLLPGIETCNLTSGHDHNE